MYGLQSAYSNLVLLRKQLELADGITPEGKGVLKAIRVGLEEVLRDVGNADDLITKTVSIYERRINKLQEQIKNNN